MRVATDNLTRARDATKLSRKTGLTGKDLGVRLGVTTQEANVLVGVGNLLAKIAESALTPAEEHLLRSIAACERHNLAQLKISSVTSFSVACAARKSQSWPGSVSSKRLRSGRRWCTKTGTPHPAGLGLIDFTGNGYLRLTSLGWLVVHALEAVASAEPPADAPRGGAA